MERSVLSSAIKTYRSKNNRTSRSYSYRPSSLIGSTKNIFEDDDDSPFDKLLIEEKAKKTFLNGTPLKIISSNTNSTPKADKLLSHGDQRSSALKNVQNVKFDSFHPENNAFRSRLSSSSHRHANKENIKFKSLLFVNESDSDGEGKKLYDYDSVTFEKNATRNKKSHKSRKNNVSKTRKIKRLQQYRGQCKANFSSQMYSHKLVSSKAVSTPKHSFIELGTGWDVSRISRKTLVVDRKSVFAVKELTEEEKADESNLPLYDKIKLLFGKFEEDKEELSDSIRPSCIAQDPSVETNFSVRGQTCNSTSEICNTSNSQLIAIINAGCSVSELDDVNHPFIPVGISTPRHSEKYDLRFKSSPINDSVPGGNKSEELDPNDLSAALPFMENRSDVFSKEQSFCDEFEKLCSLNAKSSECDLNSVLEKNEKSYQNISTVESTNWSKITGVEEKLLNNTQEMNNSVISIDVEEVSHTTSICLNESKTPSSSNSSVVSNAKAFIDANAESDGMNLSLSQSVDHSETNYTIEMRIPKSSDSDNEPSMNNESVFYSVNNNSALMEANSSSDFSDSTNEKYDTVVQKLDETSLSGCQTNQNSAFVDSLLFSVLHPSNTISSNERSSCTSVVSLPSAAEFPKSSPGNASVSSSVCVSADFSVSDSDELAVTVMEKSCPSPTLPFSNDLTSDFAGFETSKNEGKTNAKLVLLKSELNELKTPTIYPSFSSSAENIPSPNDPIIKDDRQSEMSFLHPGELSSLSYSRLRYSGILRRDIGIRPRKSVRFSVVSKFEPVHEEKGEESFENNDVVGAYADTKPVGGVVEPQQNRSYFTERRRKCCPLPTVSEAESEIDEGIASSQNSICSQTLSERLENQSIMRSSIFLSKGKKWRRSFITLKHIRDHGFKLDVSDKEIKGRCWRQNVEHLIHSQINVSMAPRELDECTVLRTGFDGNTTSGFEEGDTITEKSIYSRQTRFSLSIGIDSSCRDDITQNLILEENSIAWLPSEPHESYVSAGDHFLNRSLSRIDFSVPHTARESVLHYCGQAQPLPFEVCFDESVLKSCKKIGEGVYGEVFALKKRLQSSVIKIIPIEGDQKVNGERQKKFDEVLSELVISIELSKLRNRKDYYTNCFAEVQRCWCVQGRYPARLISLWKEYDRTKGSDNDSPKIFKDDQLYIILELNDGGQDLESFEFNNAQQALSVFKQVACALAVAEQAFRFEHRDLHWGNVLISRTRNREAKFVFGDRSRYVQPYGVKVTIIDYTLSRISINNHIFYNNIGEDPELFIAEGDFQFEVYRLMKKEVNDIWDQYAPKTNVIWLYYLLDKMINEVRYRRDHTKIHLMNIDKMKRLYARTMNFESSCDLVENQPI